jgi:hypothetical protein
MKDNQSTNASEAQDEEKNKGFLTGLDDCPLHRNSPYGVTNVSHTQLSIARYYGTINFNGFKYIYNPMADELIREDVLKWKTKQWREKQKQTKKQNEELQEEMKWI